MKNVREIGPGREQDDITGNYSKFCEMISYARMHEGSENRVYYFQSMAHGDVEKQKCIGLVPTKAWELYHSKLLPRQKKLYKARRTAPVHRNGFYWIGCVSKINAKQLGKFG